MLMQAQLTIKAFTQSLFCNIVDLALMAKNIEVLWLLGSLKL